MKRRKIHQTKEDDAAKLQTLTTCGSKTIDKVYIDELSGSKTMDKVYIDGPCGSKTVDKIYIDGPCGSKTLASDLLARFERVSLMTEFHK